MGRTRKLDELDEIGVAQNQTLSAKRACGLSGPAHYESGSPPAQSISSTSSTEAFNSSRALHEAVQKDFNSDTKHPSPSRHVSSDIQASDFPNNYHLPSPKSHFTSGITNLTFPDSYQVPSPRAPHPSGIEEDHFPDSYDISSSPIHVTNDVERAHFSNRYDISSPPVHISQDLKGVHSLDSDNPPSSPPTFDFSSTLKNSSSIMTPEQAQEVFKKQHHFFNDPDARYVVLILICTLAPYPGNCVIPLGPLLKQLKPVKEYYAQPLP